MSEWLSRDPKVTEDQNKVARLLVRKALMECGVESGRDSQASLPWHHPQPEGMALYFCSWKMELPQETGGTQTLAEVMIMAFAVAKLCSYCYAEEPGKFGLVWFNCRHALHAREDKHSAFFISLFQLLFCLPSFCNSVGHFSWLSSSPLEIKHGPCCWVPEFMTRTSFFQPQFPLTTSSQELHSDYLFCLLAPALLWMRNTAKGKQSENWFHCSLPGEKSLSPLGLA